MARIVKIQPDTLTDIAEAIREKTETTELIPTVEMAQRIRDIETLPTDATATEVDLLVGKVAYNNDGRFVGTIETFSGENEGDTNVIDVYKADLIKKYIEGNLEEIDISDYNIQELRTAAFAYRELKKIILPKSLNNISMSCFVGCKKLISVEIPENSTIIPYTSFYECESLMSIIIPPNVESIDPWAFLGCYRLVEIYNLSPLEIKLGSGIGDYAKIIHTSLDEESILFKHIYYNNFYSYYLNGETYLINYMGDDLGENDYNEIELPQVDYISERAFYNKKNIYSVSFKQQDFTTKKIGNNAFENSSIAIMNHMPSSMVEIGQYAFRNCKRLRFISINCSTIAYGAFRDCENLKTLGFSDSIIEISNYAFENCISLEEVVIPYNFKTLGSNVFKNCKKMKKISFLSNFDGIGNNVFYGCTSLVDIFFTSDSVISLSAINAFDNGANNTKIHVKNLLVENYKNADNWKTLIESGRITIVGDL